MDENTATVKVTMTVTLTGEEGVSAEQKAEQTVQIMRDQVNAVRSTYDSGVDVVGKVTYVGKSEEQL